jgi:hypothetical protein
VQAFAVAVSEQDARPRMKYTVVTEGRKLCSNSNLERRVEQSADGVPRSPFLRVRVLNWALIPASPSTLSCLTKLQDSRQLLRPAPLPRLTFE